MTLTSCVTGKSDAHIDFEKIEVPIHRRVVEPVEQLKKVAYEDEGISLTLASGFRNFERQLMIWNEKATGQRELVGANGERLNYEELSRTKLMFSILRWSALPGGSRHHWGTDFDVFDIRAIPKNYSLRLSVNEYALNGPFYKLHCWLEKNAQRLGFERPYIRDMGGVAPEPWHISYTQVAREMGKHLCIEVLESLIRSSEIELKEEILRNLDEIFEKYIVLE